jgi:hypothetical protein
MAFGFNQKFSTETTNPTGTLGVTYTRPRVNAPLVKAGGGGNNGSGLEQSGGSGGSGGTPLGCPKCVGWYWIPLGAVGVMTTLSWLLARR